MLLTALYFVALFVQMLASFGVLSINAWMVNWLINSNQLTDDTKWIWGTFYGLMAIASITIIVPFIQGLCMGCLCCGGCVQRPLSKGHYTAQAIFLVLQAALWIAAAGWWLYAINLAALGQVFGNIQYLGVACSWIAPFCTIVMIIIVALLRGKRVKADAEDLQQHNKHDA